MTDYYLRTTSKSLMESAFIRSGVALRQASGEIVGSSWDGIRADLDMIGAILPTLDKDGATIDAGDSRYHANLRVSGGELTQDQLSELPILDPAPTTPMRVFA